LEADPAQFIVSSIICIFNLMSLTDLFNLVLLFVFLLGAGLFSGAEVAMFSLSPADLEDIKEEKTESSKMLIYHKNHPRKLLALLLICNTFVNIGTALVVEQLLEHFLPMSSYTNIAIRCVETFGINSISVDQIINFFYFLVAVVGATSLILLFGEVTPKIYAQLNNRKLALWMAIPLRFVDIILKPLTFVLVGMTNKVEKRLLERRVGMNTSSKEELDAAIDLAVSQDIGSLRQVDMLKGIIKFNDVSTTQVMTSRTEVYAAAFNDNYFQVLDLVKECGFSRLPVYHDDIDHVTGILYAKDLIAHLDKDKDFEWQQLIRTNLFYVPESRKIHDLLNDFQVKKVHLAIVVDEYGGTSGIVTLEDIMEEIVGEIQDEFDDQHELNFTRLDSHNFLFDGKTLINDMCRVLGIDVYVFDAVRGSADSIAGLVLEQTNEMPKADQEITIVNFKFKVISVNKRRIEQIKVTI